MRPRLLSDLAAFHAIARDQSFTLAARRLGLTQSALSQTLKRLEEDLGLQLLSRTTRSLAPTPAGERLLKVLAPAIEELSEEIDALKALSAEPRGRLRVTCGKHAADTLVWPTLSRLMQLYPDIELELSVEDRHVDIVAERFDIGIRLRERLDLDMIALRVGPPLRTVIVGSPAYLDSRGAPASPEELSDHRCLGFRNAEGTLTSWDFQKDGRALSMKPGPGMVLNDGDALVDAAVSGMGLAYVLEDLARPALDDGRLKEVLADWSEPFPGYHAFFPSRHHSSRAMTLFLAMLREIGLDTGPDRARALPGPSSAPR
ncbi:MAG: LysR family transcriptional regulator [Rhodobacteraceae bacterium]|nr:LysR family transcriptional regulator [Paracoccaceae bacterium]MBR9822541.1 LysR family transcriptional regulator [Paracoccaceae bacterium]